MLRIRRATGAQVRPVRRIDRRLLIASMGVALGLAMIAYALASAETGRTATGLPDAIENISPQRNDEVLRQTSVVVDLAAGFSGRLIIDDRELEVVEVAAVEVADPGQVGQDVSDDVLVTRFDPGSRVLTYQPQEGAPIAAFATGVHEAKVIYWPIDDPAATRSFTWQFRVTA